MQALGKAIRDAFLLEPDFLTVNHGSFGAMPKPVRDAQDEWRRRLEAQPTRFMAVELPPLLRGAAARLAAFVGAEAQDIGFVDNATTGCNAVLRSLRLQPGDEILVLDHGYGAVRNTVRHVTERSGATMVEALIPFPRPSADAIVEAVAAKLGRKTRLVVLDHITSPSALVLPLERLVPLCQQAGAKVLVDGAHGPGMVPLDLAALNADWYTGNGHKWLCAPKGCAFLWARRDRQEDLHPVTISHGYGTGFLGEFDWAGTRDPSAYLAIDAAIDFHESLGGPALRQRNAALAAEGGMLLAQALGSELGAPPELQGSMALVRLPLKAAETPTMDQARALRRRLIAEERTDVIVNAIGGAFWLRLSAAPYNEREDYQRLAEIARRLSLG
ncbi:MAG: aminotransferase class V-fold PLP-dependent enzyme [Rhodospirillales bacterium]|nr:aminotransferase class V-fold PLP-dependent enzyme [Rhodospirillales bacterium]